MPRRELLGASKIVDARAPLVPLCGACGLYKTCSSPKMKPSGKFRDKILFVGESPGQEEDLKGEPFVGPTGDRLRKAIKKAGLDDTECLYTNAVICRPGKNQTENEHVDFCRANLLQTLRVRQPEVVVLLGAKAVRSLLSVLWKPNVGGIERWVGWHIPAHPPLNAWVCPTYHPMYLSYENHPPALERLFDEHVQNAVNLLGTRPWKKAPDYAKQVRVEYDDAKTVGLLHDMTNGHRPVAVDYETDRLKPDAKDSRIVCCAASDGVTTIAYPWTTRTRESMCRLFASDVPKIASNLKFEERWSLKEFGTPVNNWLHDTMIGAHVLDNRPEICSIKFQSFVLLGQPEYDTGVRAYLESSPADKAKYGGGGNATNRVKQIDLHALLLYCGMDALLEWKVAKIQRRRLGFTP